MIEALRQIDHALFYLVNQQMANPVFDWACPIIRDKIFLIASYIVMGLWVCRIAGKNFWIIALLGAITLLLTDQLSAHVIKQLIHRLRPCNNSGIHSRLLLQYCGSGFSFVSAHAANSFGMAMFLSTITKTGWRSFLVLGLWASLVAFSQVYVGVHFPADVAGGALLGMLIGYITGNIKFNFQFINRPKN